MTPNLRRLPSGVAATALAGLALIGLAGCTSAESTPQASPTASSAPSAPAASDSPTPTPPRLTGTPLALDCDALVDASALQTLYPGLAVSEATAGPSSTETPGPPSGPAEIAGVDGTVCHYTDTAGDTLTVAVADLDDASYTAKANDLVASSNPVPTYGVEGYFEVSAGVGIADVFNSPYWIVTESSAYIEPGDAQPVVAQVLTTLAARG